MFTAHLRSKGVDDWAGLWMRVDGAGSEQLGFDNMQDRPIVGDNEWQPYNIVMDLPQSAAEMTFGVLLVGGGEVWVDAGKVEVVADSVPTTGRWGRDANHDLAGRVVDSNGNAIDGANVVLTVKRFAPFQWQTYETKTEQGRFDFAGVYPKKTHSQMLITVYADSYAMTSDFVDNKDGGTVRELTLTLDDGTEKTFLFKNENGVPLARTTIVPTHRITAAGIRHQIYSNATKAADVTTDELGRCTLSRFNAGDQVNFYQRGDGREAEVTIDAHPSQQVTLADPLSPVAMEEKVPEPTAVASRHVRWIRQNAVRFNSIDPTDTDFADLQSLKELIGDAKIVQLGEQSHGDGACFQTKIRLIKFLHQEMGFDVLAFESGIYDCRRAWQAFQQGTDPDQAASTGVFGIWTGSKQTAELWRYLADQASSDKPLELAGFDCQFTGTASQQYLADDIRQLAAKYAPKIEMSRIDALVDQLGITQSVEKQPRDVEQDLLVIDELQTALTAATESINKSEREQLSFWQQNLKSIKQHCLNESREYAGKGIDMRRDQQMARNLVWLSKNLYPDRKIIVWAASFHIMRNPPEIEVLDESLTYRELKQMGQFIHEQLGNQVYTIGFTAYDGAAGSWLTRPFEISVPPAGTLENICQQAGLVNGMIALNPAEEGGKWLTKKIYARPLGYAWMRANWYRHFDAMVFNQTMSPSTGR